MVPGKDRAHPTNPLGRIGEGFKSDGSRWKRWAATDRRAAQHDLLLPVQFSGRGRLIQSLLPTTATPLAPEPMVFAILSFRLPSKSTLNIHTRPDDACHPV